MIKPGDIVMHARAMLGTPFHHQGRQPGVGLDCIGVPIVAAMLAGLDIHDVQGYGRTPNARLARVLLNQQVVRINKIDAMPGDILWIKWLNDPMHFAIFTGETMVHAYSQIKTQKQRGSVVEHRITDRWWKNVVEVYRFREFINNG